MSGQAYRYAWRLARKPELYGRLCRIVIVGKRMNSVLVEFEDGQREVVSRRALRKEKPNPGITRIGQGEGGGGV